LGSENLSLLVAFGAGVLSFLSPCVLPMVPAYVAYLAGNSAQIPLAEARRWTTLTHSAAFGLGFSIVFVGFWASIGLVGFVLPGYSSLMRQAGGIVLIVMGLHQIGVFRISLLYRQLRLEPGFGAKATPIASVLVGVAFAAGWSPCIGPILAGIIGLASMSETVGEGALLLVAYSLGLGVPFMATALAIGQVSVLLTRIKRHLRVVEMASGALLLVIGLLMLSDTFRLLPQYFSWGGL
jgi:cytochrome c-type biogenesis protein